MFELKVETTPEVEKAAIDWVCTQITTILDDRKNGGFDERVKKWIDQYEERLPKKKTFPWKNCSNISVPVTPIAVETIHAREVNTLFAVRPYIQIKPKKKSISAEDCANLEKFLDQIWHNVLNIYQTGSQWLLEKNKMGTGFLKLYWNFDRKKVRTPEGFKTIDIDDAALEVTALEDMLWPSNAKHEQNCSMLAQRFRTNWPTLQRKQVLGIYENIDKVKNQVESTTSITETGTDIQQKKDENVGIQRTNQPELGEYTGYEVYFEWDVDGDGFPEPTLLTLHKETKTKLRWVYHPYAHGRRPFVRNNFMERTNTIQGKGIGEMCEHIQEATNTVFNQTIDNATIANAKCFKARKQAKEDIGEVFPGKTFYLDDPQTDLQEFMLGDVKQSNFLIHNMLQAYIERRTKVNDYTSGRESSLMKSRATATGTLALLQESGRHFDLVINNSRNALVELAYQTIELYLQYRPDKIFLVTQEDGKTIEELKLPSIQNLREEYDFYCTATSLAVNKEIEKQASLLLMQQLGGVYQQMIQLLMVLYSPQAMLPSDIQTFISGVLMSYFKMAKDLVIAFEKVDVNSYIPELPETVKMAYGQGNPLDLLLQQIVGGMNGQGGIPPGMAGLNQAPEMEGVPEGTSGAEGPGMVNMQRPSPRA